MTDKIRAGRFRVKLCREIYFFAEIAGSAPAAQGRRIQDAVCGVYSEAFIAQ